MNNNAIGSNWKDVRKEIFTEGEIRESDLRVALMGEIIQARHIKGLSQKKLEVLSSVSQPVIARMEKGTSDSESLRVKIWKVIPTQLETNFSRDTFH